MIASWINKKIQQINSDSEFKRYFEDIPSIVEEDNIYFTNEEKGIELITTIDNVVVTVHFFSGKHKQAKEFKEALPDDLRFNFNRKTIHSIWGTPEKKGGGSINIIYGKIPKWDKYFFDTHTVRFEYSDNEDEILLISYASKDLEKYFSSGLQ